MDNVTHSLAGLLLAECAVRGRARVSGTEPSARFRAIAVVSSTIAANLLDSDLLYTGLGGDRLRYMLHHRGYTHTVLVALVGAVLVWAATVLIARRSRDGRVSRDDARWLFGLLFASTTSHLLLDWTNSYGVHPFWPLDDRWYYGDAVFIVEPWLWVVSIPALVAASGSRVSRAVLSLLLVAVLAVAWRASFVSTGAALALTLGGAVSIATARLLTAGARAATSAGAWILVTLVFAASCARANMTVLLAASAVAPGVALLDVVVTPLPGNPLCASVLVVERRGGTYALASARVSTAPGFVSASRCSATSGNESAMPATRRTSTRAVHWNGEWSARASELSALARESCPALAALRFMRAPMWRALDDSTVLLGDARYGGLSGSGFTAVRVPRRAAACPDAVPPWVPPRVDVIGRCGRTPRLEVPRQEPLEAQPVAVSVAGGTFGVHGAATSYASSGPGHGGIVTPTMSSVSSDAARNWNRVPIGTLTHMPGFKGVMASTPSFCRHI